MNSWERDKMHLQIFLAEWFCRCERHPKILQDKDTQDTYKYQSWDTIWVWGPILATKEKSRSCRRKSRPYLNFVKWHTFVFGVSGERYVKVGPVPPLPSRVSGTPCKNYPSIPNSSTSYRGRHTRPKLTKQSRSTIALQKSCEMHGPLPLQGVRHNNPPVLRISCNTNTAKI